jgi:hypothetical protein
MTILLHYTILPALLSSCSHLLELSILLLYFCMHTSDFSSSLRYASFSFYALLFSSCAQHTILFIFSSAFYNLCCLCMIFFHHGSPLQIMHYVSSFPHASPLKRDLGSSILHVFLMPSSLCDHHCNSSYSLAVIMSLFIISGCYAKILWLLWQFS